MKNVPEISNRALGAVALAGAVGVGAGIHSSTCIENSLTKYRNEHDMTQQATISIAQDFVARDAFATADATLGALVAIPALIVLVKRKLRLLGADV